MAYMRSLLKKGQQEIAGFVLIVVLVVIAMLVFVVISLRQTTSEIKSKTAENILSSVLSYTTECIVSQPYQESVRDLIKSCYGDEKCTNLNKMACGYLNETLDLMLPDLLLNNQTSGTIRAYEFKIDWVNEENSEEIQNRLPLRRGKCNQSSSLITGATESISVIDGTLKIGLTICSEL